MSDRTFLCVECDKDRPFGELVSQSFSFQHRLETFDVEVKICTGCFMAGGISDMRKNKIAKELGEAQEGKRW